MSTEIYFLRDKKIKKGELTKWRRYFLLEKHLDGNGSRSSKARSNAWTGQRGGAVCLVLGSAWIRPQHQSRPSAYFMDWEKHSTGGPKWDRNGSF